MGRRSEAVGARQARTATVVAVLALCGTVVSLQQTLVVPLLPDLPRMLHTAPDNASWLVTATLVAGAVAIPSLSRLADMYGKKRMMLVAIAVMVAGSVLGAVTSALPLLITARALQGVGVALIPVGIAIMRDELPPERLPLGVAVMSATLAIGSGAGLPLVGLTVEHLDWHSIFWITGAAGAVMSVAVAMVVPESPLRSAGRFDYAGALMLSGAITGLMIAITKGAHWGWLSWPTLTLASAGIALLVVWFPLELRNRSPLVDLRVSARPAVLLVNIASVLTGFAMYANMLVTTQILQQPTVTGYGLGFDIFHTGLWLAPTAVVFGAMAPIAAATIRLLGPQITLLMGAVGMGVSYVVRIFSSHDLWQIELGSVLVGVGTSLTFAAMPNLIMRAVPESETASANGLNTVLRSVGTSTSSAALAAIATAVVIRIGDRAYPSFSAFATVFWIAATASFVAGLLVLPLLRMREGPDTTAADIVVSERVLHGDPLPVQTG